MAREKIKFECPECGHAFCDDVVRQWAASLTGRVGGASKARSPEVARKAARIRWRKERARKKAEEKAAAEATIKARPKDTAKAGPKKTRKRQPAKHQPEVAAA